MRAAGPTARSSRPAARSRGLAARSGAPERRRPGHAPAAGRGARRRGVPDRSRPSHSRETPPRRRHPPRDARAAPRRGPHRGAPTRAPPASPRAREARVAAARSVNAPRLHCITPRRSRHARPTGEGAPWQGALTFAPSVIALRVPRVKTACSGRAAPADLEGGRCRARPPSRCSSLTSGRGARCRRCSPGRRRGACRSA